MSDFSAVRDVGLLQAVEVAGPGVVFLTTAQVARRLGLCRATVCLAVKEGRLAPTMKLPGGNGAYLFTEAAVVEWRSPGERLAGL